MNLLLTAALMLLLYALVHAVMWRQTWEDRRNPTRAMKRGEASRWWLLVLVSPVAGAVAVKTGHVDVARWCVAVTLGAPWLFCKPEFWMSTAAFAATTEREI